MRQKIIRLKKPLERLVIYMTNMKKVILFIVEGMSDKEALEPILSEMIDDNLVMFEVLRCDATVSNENPYHTKNMKERIKVIVDNYLENNRGIKKKYIEKLIYITDTDGCFIANEYIHFSETDEHFRYEDDGIYTKNIERAKQRNIKKSNNLNILYSASKIYDLKIETYYFSCNLDHVLYNIRNLSRDEKEKYAINFAEEYEGKEEKIVEFLSHEGIPLAEDYTDSWIKIKESLNSVLRHSNFHIFFKNNLEYFNENIKLVL